MSTRYASTATSDRSRMTFHDPGYSTPPMNKQYSLPRTAPTLRTKSSISNLKDTTPRTLRHTPSQQSLRQDPEGPRLRTQRSQINLSTPKKIEMIKQSPTLWQLAQSRIPQKKILEHRWDDHHPVGFQGGGIKVKVQNIEDQPRPWPKKMGARTTMKRV